MRSDMHWKVVTTMTDLIGSHNQYVWRVTRQQPIGRNQYQICVTGLGHWIWDKSTNECSRTCVTKYRLDCLKNKLDENNVALTRIVPVYIGK